MPMNTIKINANGGFYSGTGSFLFYKKAATGVVNTDVDVFLDNLYYATMAPTDSIVINRQFQYVRLVPADAGNFATFISAESGEEYRTAAVAGVVSVSGGYLDVNGEGRTPLDSNKAFIAAGVHVGAAAALSSSNFYFYVRTGAVAPVYVTDLSAYAYDSTTGAGVGGRTDILMFSHTSNSVPDFIANNKNNLGTNNESGINFSSGAPAGIVNSPGLLALNIGTRHKFSTPFKISPGFGLAVWCTHVAATNTKTCSASLEFAK